MFEIIKINGIFLYQVVELQNRLSEESKKADKLDFEYKRLKEKVDSLQKEKDVSIYIRDFGFSTNIKTDIHALLLFLLFISLKF